MEETQRHKDAFEYFYALGNKRSCPRVAAKFAVSDNSAKKWHRTFNWHERIQQRDSKIAKKVEQKIIKAEETTRLNSYKKIIELRDALLAVLSTAFYINEKDGKTKIRPDIQINTTRQFKDVAIGALKCETEALHILSPEPSPEQSTVVISVQSVRDLPDKN